MTHAQTVYLAVFFFFSAVKQWVCSDSKDRLPALFLCGCDSPLAVTTHSGGNMTCIKSKNSMFLLFSHFFPS